MKHKTLKHIISITISMILILSSCILVFADDSASVPDSSGTAADYSSAELEFINSAIDDNDRDIRILATEVVRSTTSTYTIDDIYNLLLAVYTTYTGRASWAVFDQSIYNEINNNFSHYDSDSGNTYDTGAMLWLVKNSLRDIAFELVPATANISSTIYQLIDNMNTALSSINYNISLGLIDGNGTPYLVNIYNKLNDISLNSVNYTNALWYNSIGCAEYLYQIKSLLIDSNNLSIAQRVNALVQIENNFANNMHLKVGSIDTKLTTTNNNLNTINNTVSNVKASIDSVNTSLQSFNNDFNNIIFNQSSSGSIDLLYNNNSPNPGSYYDNLNVNVYDIGPREFPVIYKLILPIFPQSHNSDDLIFTFYDYNNYILPVNYFYEGLWNSSVLYFQSSNYYTFKIKITSKNGLIGLTTVTPSIYFIPLESNDGLSVYTLIQNYNSLLHFTLWKDIYASDDIINAKEEQKPLEDSVLEDFTGSGSASASVSDAVDIKGVQSSVKGSLDTGNVQASGLSTILNTSNPTSNTSFFTFFSQAVYNDVNGINTITQTRDMYYHIDDSALFNDLVGEQSW